MVRCVMAITLLELSSAKPSNFNTDVHTRARKDKTNNDQEAVQYRQLISRAVTQRLHSPSLDDLTKTKVGVTPVQSLEEWELQERCIAQSKARIEAEELGIPWTQLVHDVESTTLQVHVLTPTRYEVPPRNINQNQEATKQNEEMKYTFGDSEDAARDQEWKTKDAAVYNMLRAFRGARSGRLV
ncbi:uncharacterized protein J4E87_003737 [Alternaria ethzedia]|uniref:uncharacterized protein n=1 Tax=Alternaria ethzedia TaxID=181014 RepID=UPI0020C321EA|nr:uncharacterized protein J4E87_003737 [Alternaria ethzedia]KAI4629473.1 hypothetical protein J4E87_003737 [Alternaria ethzedia]